MSSTVVAIREADDPRDVIHRAVHLLAEGGLVAMPTETVYVVAALALKGQAVERLAELSADGRSGVLSLCLKGEQEAADYVPSPGVMGRRLLRRCCPGPVAFQFPAGERSDLLAALPDETDRVLRVGDVLRLRVPEHAVAAEVQRLLPAPLVITPERLAAGAPAGADAESLRQRFGESLAMIVEDGPTRYGRPASLVEVDGESWRLLEEGVVSESMLRRLAGEFILFVCTGNTCRSPMAEGIFRRLMAGRLACREDELPERGFNVASAGLSASYGQPATNEAVHVTGRHGIDLSGHSSRPVVDELLDQADRVYTMTQSHLDSILSLRPEMSGRVELLSPAGSDISDPVGGGLEEYESCRREIEHAVESLVHRMKVRQP